LANSDNNIQKFSGYKQFDFMQKLLWKPSVNQAHEINIQYSTTGNVPRYDRLTDTRNGALRWAEWYYGPQDRCMLAYSYRNYPIQGFFNDILVGINYQKIEESRMQRAYQKLDKEHRIENVNVLGYNIDLRKKIKLHEINIGTDAQLNFLKSTAFKENIVSHVRDNKLDTRYPDGKNTMSNFGIYYQYLYKIIPNALILNHGLRLSYSNLHSTFIDTSILHLPFTVASQQNINITGNAGLVYLSSYGTKWSMSLSSGFRSPNFDDMAKVFESAGGTQVVVPNPNLKPERTYNISLGFQQKLFNSINVEVNAYYTAMTNAIVLDKYIFNGKDSMLYAGVMTPVVASQNRNGAKILGFNASLSVALNQYLQFYTYCNYTYGRYKEEVTGNTLPLDHIPPFYGKTGIIFKAKKWRAEFNVLYNGWKHIGDYNPYGEDNQQYATVYGMPARTTFNFLSKYNFNKYAEMQLGVENILDQNYRTFASGISGAGRNLVIKLKFNF
jgi:hemoglobin/transferrin/lactoferrin receptor protein